MRLYRLITRNLLLNDLTDGRMRATRSATRRDLKQEAFFPQAIFLSRNPIFDEVDHLFLIIDF